MEQIYEKIFELAKPYYEKARPYDILAIEWMIGQADRIADIEDLDKKLLLPLIILHDIGYARVAEDNPDVKDIKSKKIHMEEGAKIANAILIQLDYDQKYIEKITYYVSIHDNWIFNDDIPFKECKEMGVFNDLDFMYPLANPSMLKARADSMGETIEENIKGLKNDEKLKRRPLCCEQTKKLFKQLIEKAKTY
ncbi:hypothetical protein GOV04_04035 [Candidatus Woesearchaeota archaeon]|nr:hypothetical protein [Candidatus Woesearchaeota archaeon]